MVRKRAFWQQRWFWATLGVLAVAAIVFGVLMNIRSNNRKEQRIRQLAAVQNYATAVQNVLPDDRTAVSALVNPFPTFHQTIDELGSGKQKPAQVTQEATAVEQAAGKTATALNTIDTSKLVPREFADLRATLNDSKLLFEQSFRLYIDAAALTRQAAALDGDQRKALVTSAGDVASRASLLFQSGLRKMTGQITRLGGTFQPIQPPPPTPTPAPTPSASASPTPTSSASATPSG